MLRREDWGGSKISSLLQPDLPTLSKSSAESNGLFFSALEPVFRSAEAAILMIEYKVRLVATLGERMDLGSADLSLRRTGLPEVGGLGE